MIIGIHHIAIGVPDFEQALTFYTEVLGFEQVEGAQFSGKNDAVEAAIGTAHRAVGTFDIGMQEDALAHHDRA